MQRTAGYEFLSRLLEYGHIMQEKNQMPTQVLGLLNLKRVKGASMDQTVCYGWYKVDPKTDLPAVLDCGVTASLIKVNLIDLRVFRDKNEIAFGGHDLNIIGVTWLKLFGVRQWGEPVKDEPWKFKIFYPDCIDPLFKKVIDILSIVDLSHFREFMVKPFLAEEPLVQL